jgi:hypothetical protein
MLIELQFTVELDYLHRILYGTSKTITERMAQGNPYTKVTKVDSINIVYFGLEQGNDYVYHGGNLCCLPFWSQLPCVQ